MREEKWRNFLTLRVQKHMKEKGYQRVMKRVFIKEKEHHPLMWLVSEDSGYYTAKYRSGLYVFSNENRPSRSNYVNIC